MKGAGGYALTRINNPLYLNDNNEPIETKTIDFVGKDKTVRKEVLYVEDFSYATSDEKEVHYYGYNGEEMIRSCSHPLKM